MNILNFDPKEVKGFSEVFKIQREIMVKFEPKLIDRIDSFDIDIYEDQMLLKDFLLSRLVEELTEASVALGADHEIHFKEEIIDAMNFLVESYILYGWNEKKVKCDDFSSYMPPFNPSKTLIRQKIYDLIEQIGLTCNKLKIRPWRHSQYVVDLRVFEEEFLKIWEKFIDLCITSNISKKDLLNTWSQKMQVNNFRLSTNY